MGGFDEGSSISFAGSALETDNEQRKSKVLGGKIDQNDDGLSASGSVFEGEEDGSTKTIGKVELKDGRFQEDDGETRFGRKAAVTGDKTEIDLQKKFGLNEGLVVKGDKATGTASAEATVGENGLSIGMQANAGEASATVGTTGTGDRDETTRFGLSEGVGLAGRVHWGDSDKDEIPEYGVGADFGPVSFDVKTEDPLGTGMRIMSASRGGMVIPPSSDSNMTLEAMAAAEQLGTTVGQAFNSAPDLTQTASDGRDQQNQRDAELAQQVADGGQQIYEHVEATYDVAEEGLGRLFLAAATKRSPRHAS
jgi:hypothetical protein